MYDRITRLSAPTKLVLWPYAKITVPTSTDLLVVYAISGATDQAAQWLVPQEAVEL